jgi:hypothetical protein
VPLARGEKKGVLGGKLLENESRSLRKFPALVTPYNSKTHSARWCQDLQVKSPGGRKSPRKK